jgi:hypothetical protein
MKKTMIAAALVAGIGLSFAMRSTTAVAKEEAPSEMVTEAQVNAVIDARLHELLKQKIEAAQASAEQAANER